MMATYAIMSLDLNNMVNTAKIPAFTKKIFSTYSQDVTYHNDLHGADVMQVAYYMLRKGGLESTLKLSKIHMLSFLLAAVCHDLGHDGFTNSYHVNFITKRAID